MTKTLINIELLNLCCDSCQTHVQLSRTFALTADVAKGTMLGLLRGLTSNSVCDSLLG